MSVSLKSKQIQGSLAIVFGAGVWGLFWIPLRYLSDAGLGPLWAPLVLLLGSLPIAAFAAAKLGKWETQHSRWMLLVGLCFGFSQGLYFYAVISTDVIRAIFLFYMLPVWATLVDRLVFRVKVGPVRALAVLVAFAGLWLLLGGDGGLPMPRNSGDWAGLAAGFFWGTALSLVKARAHVDPYYNSMIAVFFGVIVCAVAALLFGQGVSPEFEVSALLALAILAFGTLIYWPSVIGQIWGARFVPATRAALLTMSEIVIATVSAWALIGTSMTWLSIIGGCVIVAAVAVDSLTAESES